MSSQPIPSIEPLLTEWRDTPSQSGRILPEEFYVKPWAHISLGQNRPAAVKSDPTDWQSSATRIFGALAQVGARVGYGGYGERRECYAASEHFRGAGEARSIHLGVDLWVLAGTPILCPWPGRIHSYADNRNHLDYGPTIILEHQSSGIRWHTLYGHLSRRSLEGLEVGQSVVAGQELANIGEGTENGGWVPHLHFQVILDLGNWRGDYPGVSTPKDWPFYAENCPDPAFLLRPNLGEQLSLY